MHQYSVTTATLAGPAPKPAAALSRRRRWPIELPGRSGPWRCIARASRNRSSPAGRHRARVARITSGIALRWPASIRPVPGAPSRPPRRTRVARTRPGTRVPCGGRATSGRTARKWSRPRPGQSACAGPRSGTTWAFQRVDQPSVHQFKLWSLYRQMSG